MTLKDRIKHHEGFRLKKYKCSAGAWTIYYGHKCLPGEVYLGTKEDAEKYLDSDIRIARKAANKIFPDFAMFSQARRECIVELLFNLGETRFRGFVKMIHNINIGHWKEAAEELMDSKWYRQDVGRERADALVEMLRDE